MRNITNALGVDIAPMLLASLERQSNQAARIHGAFPLAHRWNGRRRPRGSPLVLPGRAAARWRH
jgi:hypothetical protein